MKGVGKGIESLSPQWWPQIGIGLEVCLNTSHEPQRSVSCLVFGFMLEGQAPGGTEQSHPSQPSATIQSFLSTCSNDALVHSSCRRDGGRRMVKVGGCHSLEIPKASSQFDLGCNFLFPPRKFQGDYTALTCLSRPGSASESSRASGSRDSVVRSFYSVFWLV